MERDNLGCYLERFLHRRFMKAIKKSYESSKDPWNYELLQRFVDNEDSSEIREAIEKLSPYSVFFEMFSKEMSDIQWVIFRFILSDRFICSLCKEVLRMHRRGEF